MQASAYEACDRTRTSPSTPKMSKACNKLQAIICKQGNKVCGYRTPVRYYLISNQYAIIIFVITVSSFQTRLFCEQIYAIIFLSF